MIWWILSSFGWSVWIVVIIIIILIVFIIWSRFEQFAIHLRDKLIEYQDKKDEKIAQEKSILKQRLFPKEPLNYYSDDLNHYFTDHSSTISDNSDYSFENDFYTKIPLDESNREYNMSVIDRLNALDNTQSFSSRTVNSYVQPKYESVGENVCRKVLEDLYQTSFPSTRPNFLRNPETGYNLELDGYSRELNMAFEYQGKQHYEYPNDFHSSKQHFLQQVRRDRFKAEKCQQMSVYLLVIPYSIPTQEIRQYILNKINQALI